MVVLGSSEVLMSMRWCPTRKRTPLYIGRGLKLELAYLLLSMFSTKPNREQ